MRLGLGILFTFLMANSYVFEVLSVSNSAYQILNIIPYSGQTIYEMCVYNGNIVGVLWKYIYLKIYSASTVISEFAHALINARLHITSMLKCVSNGMNKFVEFMHLKWSMAIDKANVASLRGVIMQYIGKTEYKSIKAKHIELKNKILNMMLDILKSILYILKHSFREIVIVVLAMITIAATLYFAMTRNSRFSRSGIYRYIKYIISSSIRYFIPIVLSHSYLRFLRPLLPTPAEVESSIEGAVAAAMAEESPKITKKIANSSKSAGLDASEEPSASSKNTRDMTNQIIQRGITVAREAGISTATSIGNKVHVILQNMRQSVTEKVLKFTVKGASTDRFKADEDANSGSESKSYKDADLDTEWHSAMSVEDRDDIR